MSATLEVINVSKSFDRSIVRGGYTTFKTQLVQWLVPRKHTERIERQKLDVLKGIDFKVEQGETLGIIGRNGAGKSTLLKLLTGVYKPTSGSVRRGGRISALLELGAGFHPEFSGRENIYMNGMILGLSRKELRQREEEIIAFAELSDFIDAPVRTYSSGMYMRLAFAVAINVDPDILIIDEILSVGDAHFSRKSKAKLDEFKTKNRTIVLVTHDLGTVEKWCTRALWLHEGKVAADGDPRFVTQQYLKEVERGESEQRVNLVPVGGVSTGNNRWGSDPTHIARVVPTAPDGTPCGSFESGREVCVSIDLSLLGGLPADTQVSARLFSPDGAKIAQATQRLRELVDTSQRDATLRCTWPNLCVNLSYIRVDVAVTLDKTDIDYCRDAARIDVLARDQDALIPASATWHAVRPVELPRSGTA